MNQCLGVKTGDKTQFVRAILFNKTAEQNWSVTWHQDRTVAVSKKFDLPEWTLWSIKDKSHHVQPPLHVLNDMVTCRIHLDKNNQDSGCLQIIPNSHKSGILSHADIQSISAISEIINCEGDIGSILLMRPHLLHASKKMTKSIQRRVLHIEYTKARLPEGVEWS